MYLEFIYERNYDPRKTHVFINKLDYSLFIHYLFFLGGEGCYRCSNGGNCTAPDVCTCAPGNNIDIMKSRSIYLMTSFIGWGGFDCKTPTCEVVADKLTRLQLGTVYEEKVIAFESDPCGLQAIYGRRGWRGTKYTRGNCTKPNECTCLCKVPYRRKACQKDKKLCYGPWQDPMVALRNVLYTRGLEFTFGTTDCAYGYEGNVNELDRFTTCHQTIYYPSLLERSSLILVIVCSVLGLLLCICYYKVRQRLRRRYLLMKIDRRKKQNEEIEMAERANLLSSQNSDSEEEDEEKEEFKDTASVNP